MLRVIKFRGVTPQGKRIVGDLIHRGLRVAIRPFDDEAMPFGYRVLPDSVAQFTGLYDALDQELYENAELMRHYRSVPDDPDETVYQIFWHEGWASFVIIDPDGISMECLDNDTAGEFVAIESEEDRKTDRKE